MYIPAAFALTDPQELHRILREYPLGTLVTHGPQGLDADHIPFEFDPDAGPLGTLRAHVARANPVWQQVAAGSLVLVVFRGEQAYVSPNWYPSKHEAHRQVPTWNYEVVHAHGNFTAHDDERYLRGVVARLTRHHEVTEPKPWKMTDSAPEYIDSMLKAIVGIEIAITRLEGKTKLSQNRETRDRHSAAQTLIRQGQAQLGEAMQKTIDPEA